MFNRQKIRSFEDKIGIWFSMFFCKLASLFVNKDRLLIKGFYKNTKQVVKKYNLNQIQIYPQIHANLALPKTYDYIHEEFSHTEVIFPEETVVQISAARVYGWEGLLVLPDNMGVLDVNIMGNAYKSLKKIGKVAAPFYLEGNSVFLCTNWSNFYYHWIIDLLPKLHLLQKSGLQVNHYIVNGIMHDFQRQALDLAGIPKDKIIETEKFLNIKCENLIVPSQPGYMGFCPKWACDYLKELLAGDIADSSPINIYISRSKASQRKILNEDEVFEFLSEKNFHRVYLEELLLKDQIKLFKNARMIIAPHGSGLTNIVFSNSGTKLVEIFSPTYMEPCYWRLANALELDYSYILGRENVENHNIIVDIEKLKNILEK